MKLTIIILMLPVVIALLTLSECSHAQPESVTLASMKQPVYVPGTEDFTVWEVTHD